jgi:hypothetical protein
MRRTSLVRTLLLLAVLLAVSPAHAAEPFAIRGYYTTFMRSPTFGLAEWKQMVDCMHEDGANFWILWMAGAFRSKQFPITWQYNADHQNVQHDFARELIDYAHAKGMKVVLGFTPFAYDGTNQYPLEHPELRATQKDGTPAALWGMHSWGYNLCAARDESQKFMREYIREMFFDFYPNADGLLIESSDYAICYCGDCRGTYFDREYAFARDISEEVWRAKKDATVIVYPRYFSSEAVPGFDVAGSRQTFDKRWSMSFTPHSAQIDVRLAAAARSTFYWNDALTIGTPARIRDGARTARQRGLTAYITSCEPFSCIDGPPGSGKPRQKPFHFGWLADGQMPLNELLIRVNRLAYREYTANPELTDEAFRSAVETQFFPEAQGQANERVDDLLYLQASWFEGAEWFKPNPLLHPAELIEKAKRESWPPEKLSNYKARIERLRSIANRYEASTGATEREMARIVRAVVFGSSKNQEPRAK